MMKLRSLKMVTLLTFVFSLFLTSPLLLSSAQANFEFLGSSDEQYNDLTNYPLFKIISEPENNLVHELSIGLDESGSITTIVRQSSVDTQTISVEDFTSNKVIVVAKNSGRNALTIQCSGTCTKEMGGVIKLSYLYNGINNSYRDLHLVLKREQNSMNWLVLTSEGIKVEYLRITPRHLLGQLIGVNVSVNK